MERGEGEKEKRYQLNCGILRYKILTDAKCLHMFHLLSPKV